MTQPTRQAVAADLRRRERQQAEALTRTRSHLRGVAYRALIGLVTELARRTSPREAVTLLQEQLALIDSDMTKAELRAARKLRQESRKKAKELEDAGFKAEAVIEAIEKVSGE